MNIADLQLPEIRRRKLLRPGAYAPNGNSIFPKTGDKPPAPAVPTLEFTGDKLAEFVNESLAHNAHFTAEQVNECRNATKITGIARPDSSLGKLIGVMHARYWYIA
jgi:hypothetical protein